jgi:polyhydroxybutyrate depolymerase
MAKPQSGWSNSQLSQGSLPRYFRYYVPKNLPERSPVVILLHGGTQSMHKVVAANSGGAQAWSELAEREKFLLIVPNGVDETGDPAGDRQNWNDCRADQATTADDVGFMRELMNWADATYTVNNRRIYATGASNGGMMAYRLGMEMPDRIAAIAAFVANLPADSECKPKNQPIPTLIANGTADPIMPWAGGTVAPDSGRVLSSQATVDYWLRVNRSDRATAQRSRLPNLNRRDQSTIDETRYPASPGGAIVLFYQVNGGGHAMPSQQYELPRVIQRRLVGLQNQDLEGAEAAWAFFKQQSQSLPVNLLPPASKK